ncbi:MAG: hypothetical protein NVSMB29_10400 [Candidatus Dormibacteria bacterium]
MIGAGRGVSGLSAEQRERYSRHLVLGEIGEEGQRRLRAARVCILGLGGLGSPVALYLAASGVGALGLVDGDTVDLSNLQRQIIHAHSARGRSKAEAARDAVLAMSPDCEAVAHPVALDRHNALEILAGYDIVVDGTDTFQTRYLANDAAYLLDKPLVHASIFRFEGQVTVLMPGSGCYRCIYPQPPPPGMVPSCRDAGVLAGLPGVVGSIQAVEVMKLVTGAGRPLVGRLLLHDTLAMTFRELRVRRNPACVLCGDSATQRELIDYDAFVSGSAQPASR